MEKWRDLRKMLYSPAALVIADHLLELHRLLYYIDRKEWIVLLGDTIDELICRKKYSNGNYLRVYELYHEIGKQIAINECLLVEVAERE